MSGLITDTRNPFVWREKGSSIPDKSNAVVWQYHVGILPVSELLRSFVERQGTKKRRKWRASIASW